MSALHQGPDDRGVIGTIKEVLKQRIGADRFGLWFGERVHFVLESSSLILLVDGEFALERLRGNYLRAVESVAAEVLQRMVPVRLQLAGADDLAAAAPATAPSDTVAAAIVDVTPADKPAAPAAKTLARRRLGAETTTNCGATARRPGGRLSTGGPAALADVLMAAATEPRRSGKATSAHRPATPRQSARATTIAPSPTETRGTAIGPSPRSIRVTTAPAGSGDEGQATEASGAGGSTGAATADRRLQAPGGRGLPMTFGTFLTATSNTLATTAAQMLTASPANAAPLCLWGATGTGKTHLLAAIRHELRTRHRLPRVILMSAEEFTNDFLSCVRGTGLPAFRKRYRDVDALLIDNIQFLGGKSATLREMLYTVDAILSRGRPLVLAGDRQPLEIDGLSSELAGRMSSGLVCGINPMELQLRRDLYRRHSQQSFMPWDDATIDLLAERTVGDGRVIQGVSQLVSMLQRMYRRMPTPEEIMTHAGDLLQRGTKAVALADVERAVCTAFGLPLGELKGGSKARNVSQPRILAMYLSRQHTTAAFAEIGRYYGDRNHSTVIAAHRRVEDWLKNNQPVGGRGPNSIPAKDAIAAVENLLRIG